MRGTEKEKIREDSLGEVSRSNSVLYLYICICIIAVANGEQC